VSDQRDTCATTSRACRVRPEPCSAAKSEHSRVRATGDRILLKWSPEITTLRLSYHRRDGRCHNRAGRLSDMSSENRRDRPEGLTSLSQKELHLSHSKDMCVMGYGTVLVGCHETPMNLMRWLYRGGRPNRIAAALNWCSAVIHALGVAPNDHLGGRLPRNCRRRSQGARGS
jgi:hypothetical protein